MSTTTKTRADAMRQLPRNRRELLAHLNDKPAPPAIVEEATEIKELVLLTFGGGRSIAASILYSKCHHHIPTTAIETQAVMLMADGTTVYAYNPYFTRALGEEGAKFVMMHEALHIVYRHLFNDPALRADPKFTLATELGINLEVMRRMQKFELPQVKVYDENDNPVLDDKGRQVTKSTGVDPRKVYDEYCANLKEQKLRPVTFEDFTATDFGCYTELKRMKTDDSAVMKILAGGGCCHGDGDGEGGEGGDGTPMDDDVAADMTKATLGRMMRDALNGSEGARAELLGLGARTDGATEGSSKFWGDLGLGRLRGETLKARRVDWWQQWLNDTLASRIEPGEKLCYNKKRGALDIMLGNDPILGHRGDMEVKVVIVALDTSASMDDYIVAYLTKLVGNTDGVEFRWVMFDGAVETFVPGEAVRGGGGTNFANVMDYAEGRLAVDGKKLDVHPDAIVMLTDGGAAPIRPAEPDKWIWLITENGDDDWIRAQGLMDSHKITTGDGA